MSKKNWLVIGVVVLVAFGIYFYNSDVDLGPFDLKERSDASAKTCGFYDLVSFLDKNSLKVCTERYSEEITGVAREHFSDLVESNQESTRSTNDGCVGDANVDGLVNQEDIDAVFDNWGKCNDCDADVHPVTDGNGIVNSDDLLLVLFDFGCGPPTWLVFATNEKYSGDFGGIYAADEICNNEANQRGLSGEYRAFLSAHYEDFRTTINAIDRVEEGKFVNIYGQEIAENKFDLINSPLNYPLEYWRDGNHLSFWSWHVWTGSDEFGEYGGNDCNGWNYGGDPDLPPWEQEFYGSSGVVGSIDEWMFVQNLAFPADACSADMSILCFQVTEGIENFPSYGACVKGVQECLQRYGDDEEQGCMNSYYGDCGDVDLYLEDVIVYQYSLNSDGTYDVYVDAEIHNGGNLFSGPFEVSIVENGITYSSTDFFGLESGDSIILGGPGGHRLENIPPGEHNFELFVDSQETIPEIDETNNVGYYEVNLPIPGGADLTIPFAEINGITCYGGTCSAYFYTGVSANIGEGDSSPFVQNVFNWETEETLFSAGGIVLNAGQSSVWSEMMPGGMVAGGFTQGESYQIGFKIDSTEVVDETDETNNIFGPIEFVAEPFP